MANDDTQALLAQLIAENAALRRRLPRDEDTGLYSRAHFDERLAYEWRRALATWTGLCLVYIDMTAWADEQAASTPPQMRRIALLLEDACREVDIPCRVGPTSFAIILPDTNRTGAEAECARLRERLDDEALGLGIAVAFDEAKSPLEMMLIAGDAGYADRCQSLLPPVGEEFSLGDDERCDDVLIPTQSELPLFDPAMPLFDQEPVEVDEDKIETIPAGRPPWMAA